MQVEHKTEKGTVLFVKITDNVISLTAIIKYALWFRNEGGYGYFKLPSEGFQLIGLTSDITEEQANMILPVCYNGYNEEGYTIYGLKPHEVIDPAFITALHSFKSLMQHLQVYEINNCTNPDTILDQFNTDGKYNQYAYNNYKEAYERAESRTGKWIVLFKTE